MKLYKKGDTYSWEIDRFHFFTESERSAIWDGLKEQRKRWQHLEAEDITGGVVEMYDNLIKEIEKSMDK